MNVCVCVCSVDMLNNRPSSTGHANMVVILPDRLVMVHLGYDFLGLGTQWVSLYWFNIGACSWRNVGSHQLSLCSVGVPSGHVLGPQLFALCCFPSGR